MIRALRSHPIAAASGAAVLLAAFAWLAFGFFGVQTLFVDDEVSEAAPVFDAPAAAPAAVSAAAASPAAQPDTAAESETSDTFVLPDNVWPAETDAPATPATVAPAPQPPTPGEIVTEFEGGFRTIDKSTSGSAVVLGNGTGQRFLRFEDFSTGNGPDLDVWLLNSSTGDTSDHINLGALKGNVGEQNYEIPEGVDLSVYDTVVIWCERFSSAFGDAVLEPMV